MKGTLDQISLKPALPPHWHTLRSVVAALLRRDGTVIDCNAGFQRLMRLHRLPAQAAVDGLFLAPEWAEIIAADYQGVLALGTTDVRCHTLIGSIWHDGDCVSILAEYDVDGLERATDLVLQLNERLAETQRELTRERARLRKATREMAAQHDQLETHVVERTAELTRAFDQLKLTHAAFLHTQHSITITDANGIVVAVNPAFTRVTEYPAEEAIGRHIRLLKSGVHDRSFYLQMWETIHRTGSWQGQVQNRRRSGDVYQAWLGISVVRDEAGKPLHYIGVGSDLSRVDRAMAELEYLAHHDMLTGLPNRLQLATRLEHSIERSVRDGRCCAVLYIDLDKFKPINDCHGHAAGDELLCQVAQRMQAHLRHVDTIARIGGDEFVIVLEGIAEAEQAYSFAESLIQRISAPYRLASRQDIEVQVGASVGIALFPDDADGVATLLEQADSALYDVKRNGGRHWRRACGTRAPILE